jgi:osmotically inducible lipoprotein OsmB
MIRKGTAIVLVGGLLALGGCGYNRGDRAISGGLIGAGGGAAIAGLAGGNAGTGALIGAGAGALTGALTSGHDLNLGRPVWR